MPRAGTKIGELDEAKIRQAIWMLKVGKTKKECCEHLGIAYNTTRLTKILDEFKLNEEKVAKLKEKAKTKEFSELEKKEIAQEYLEGKAVSNIAKMYHVTDYRIKKILKELQVPIRGRGKNKEAKVDHIVQNLDTRLSVGDRVFYVPTSDTCLIKQIYDEEYAEYLSNPVRERYVHMFDAKDEYQQTREGVHYEVYWVYDNGKEMKRLAVQSIVNGIYDNIEKNGRESYLIWRLGDYARYIESSRENILPIEVK